jgi:hypothetical protein
VLKIGLALAIIGKVLLCKVAYFSEQRLLRKNWVFLLNFLPKRYLLTSVRLMSFILIPTCSFIFGTPHLYAIYPHCGITGKRAAYELNFTRLGEKGAQRTESLAQEKS